MAYGADMMTDDCMANRENMKLLLERIEKLERKVSEAGFEIDLISDAIDTLRSNNGKNKSNI